MDGTLGESRVGGCIQVGEPTQVDILIRCMQVDIPSGIEVHVFRSTTLKLTNTDKYMMHVSGR